MLPGDDRRVGERLGLGHHRGDANRSHAGSVNGRRLSPGRTLAKSSDYGRRAVPVAVLGCPVCPRAAGSGSVVDGDGWGCGDRPGLHQPCPFDDHPLDVLWTVETFATCSPSAAVDGRCRRRAQAAVAWPRTSLLTSRLPERSGQVGFSPMVRDLAGKGDLDESGRRRRRRCWDPALRTPRSASLAGPGGSEHHPETSASR